MIASLRRSSQARAFGEGSDARLAGRPASSNPYPTSGAEHYSWMWGWEDVAGHWGEATRSWVRPLPPVAESGIFDGRSNGQSAG